MTDGTDTGAVRPLRARVATATLTVPVQESTTLSETGQAASAMPIAMLRLVLARAVDLSRIPEALGQPDAPWLGEPAPVQAPTVRRFLCDLELHAGGSERALLRKSAIVGFGEPTGADGVWVVPIEWRAASLAPLFPVFAGRLRIHADGIELDGSYAPPSGRLGYLLDVALLGVAARGTGRWFLGKLASALA